MNKNPLIEQIKDRYGLKTNLELAEKLDIHKSQITRWQKNGLYPSTESLIRFLLDEEIPLESVTEELEESIKVEKEQCAFECGQVGYLDCSNCDKKPPF